MYRSVTQPVAESTVIKSSYMSLAVGVFGIYVDHIIEQPQRRRWRNVGTKVPVVLWPPVPKETNTSR